MSQVKPVGKGVNVQAQTIPVLFKWQEIVVDHAMGVFLSGTFNNWTRQAMKFCDNEFIESIGRVLQQEFTKGYT